MCTDRSASIYKLVEYFENLYLGITDAIYELKGLEISTDVIGSLHCETTPPKTCIPMHTENLTGTKSISNTCSSQESDTLFCSCRGCCFVCFYAICFSILKGISNWNENTPKGYVYEIFDSVTSAIEVLVRILTDKKELDTETYEMQL